MGSGRCRYRERQIGIDLAKEEKRTGFARQEKRVLSAPAKARFRRKRDLEDRRAVGEHSKAEFADLVTNALRELAELCAHHLVIVAAQRVASDIRFACVGENGFRIARLTRPVVHSRGDDAERSRHQLGGTRAPAAVSRHIIHVAMPIRTQPVEQADFVRGEIGVGDADFLKSQLTSPLHDHRRERGPIVVRVGHGRRSRVVHAH